jgi:hypothetical protein
MRRAGSCYQHNEFTKVPVVCLGAPRSLAGDSCSITSGGGMDLVAWGNCLGCLNFKLRHKPGPCTSTTNTITIITPAAAALEKPH